MSLMLGSEVTTATSEHGFTRADKDSLPDDGQRHELIDGTLVMTPSPGGAHANVSIELAYVLRGARPPGLKVYTAPFDVVLNATTVVVPDLIVARAADITERDLPVAPLLAIEIASRSTWLFDRRVKFAHYEEAGVLSYWIVDPAAPSITAWHLRGGRYTQVAHVEGDDLFETDQPFDVSFTPADLLL